MAGNVDSAITDFEAGLKLMPDNADLHYNRATALTSKGQHAKAILGYTEAIRLSPGLVPAYVNRASGFERLGERDKAIADYRKALEIAPALPLVRRKLQELGAD